MVRTFILLLIHYTFSCSSPNKTENISVINKKTIQSKLHLPLADQELWNCYSVQESKEYGIFEEQNYTRLITISILNDSSFNIYYEGKLNAEGIIESGRNNNKILSIKKQISQPHLLYIGEMQKIGRKDTIVVITQYNERISLYYYFVKDNK